MDKDLRRLKEVQYGIATVALALVIAALSTAPFI